MKIASKLLVTAGFSLGLFLFGALVQAADVDSVQLGRSLYRGTQAFAAPAQLGQVALPASSAACANCHGLRGEGKLEAGISAPPIQWRRLITSRDNQSGFANEATIVNAIALGQGRQQQALLAPMPQFSLSKQEQAALLAYLRVVGTEFEPVLGVSDKAITIGSVLPLSGRRVALGRAIQTALEARLAEVNNNGGIFGRKIVLKVADAGESTESAMQAARVLMNQDIFALLGSFVPEAQSELVTIARSQNVPVVSSLGLPLKDSTDDYLTYLLPSLTTQTQQLLMELPRYCASDLSSTLLLHAAEPRLNTLVQQLQARDDDANIHTQVVANGSQIQAALQAFPASRVIALLSPDLANNLRQQLLESKAPVHCLGTLAVLSGHPANSVNAMSLNQVAKHSHIEVIVLPMPPLMQADNAPPLTEAQLWPMLENISVQTFVEALARSGRALDTPTFLQAFSTLRAYETASGLRVTFTEKQHYGLNVAYLWKEENHEPDKLSP